MSAMASRSPRMIAAALVAASALACGGGGGGGKDEGGRNAGAAPAISDTTLGDGTVGAAYARTLAVTGGTAPLTFAATGLPAGLSVAAATGAITGTPSAAFTGTVHVTVTDSASPPRSQGKDLALQVFAAPTFTAAAPPDATVGVAYSYAFAVAGGKAPLGFDVSAGALPAGFSLSSAGVLSGTWAAAGSASFTVRVRDPNDGIATAAVTLASYAPPQITTAALPDGHTGVAYSRTLAATGGKAPLGWSLAAGALPAGLGLDAATGTISGTTAAGGTASFTVRVEDANAAAATQALTLTMSSASPAVTVAALPDAVQNAPYSATVTCSGCAAPLTWSVTAGALPSGLSLDPSTGVLSGTAPSTAAATPTFQVQDAFGLTASATLPLTVVAPLYITSGSPLATAYQSVSFTSTLFASGGRPPYAWSVTAGALPAGLTLSAAGVLSGTPTAAGTSTFTLAITDANGRQSTSAMEQTVVPLPSVTTASLPEGYTDAAYAQTLAGSGGLGPYEWTVTAGALPAGLSLALGGTLSGTPTTPGSATFTVQQRDFFGHTATASLTIAVHAPPQLTTTTLADVYTDAAASLPVTATGGKAPLSFSVSAGALPAGLTLDPATGTISGTATTPGAYPFTVTVSDANARTASAALQLGVYAPPAIATTSVADPYKGQAYSATLAATGGKGPITWAAGGNLPPGLSLAANGAISGTPTAASTDLLFGFPHGPWSATVEATDANGRVASQAYTITVYALPTITVTTLPPASEWVPYGASLGSYGAGGKPPYTFTATGLPAGVSVGGLSGDALVGTPSLGAGGAYSGPTAGSYSPTLTITDANGKSASATPGLQVLVPAAMPGGGTGTSTTALADTLTVLVVDATTNAAVMNAAVRLQANGVLVAEDTVRYPGGRALFSGVPATGPFDVTVAMSGYAATTIRGFGGPVVTVPLVPRPMPGPRYGAAAAYLPGVGPMVFGGYSGAISTVRQFSPGERVWSDLLSWDGTASAWQERSPNAVGPAGTLNGGLASVGSSLLLFGGLHCSTGACAATADAWTWSATGGWSAVGGAPTARSQVVLAGEGNGKALLFGGANGAAAVIPDVFEYDGTVTPGTWQRLTVASATNPAARYAATGAFDTVRGKLVVFGGYVASAVSGETWEFDRASRTWTLGAAAPAGRLAAAAAFDGDTGVTWVFGGAGATSAQTYAGLMKWNGTSWTAVTPVGAGPIARHSAALTYDAAAKKLVLFGGIDASGRILDSTWTYTPATNAWAQVAGSPEGLGIFPICMFPTSVQANVTGAKPAVPVTLSFAEKWGQVKSRTCTPDATGACSVTQGYCGTSTVQVVAVQLDPALTYPTTVVAGADSGGDVVSTAAGATVPLPLATPTVNAAGYSYDRSSAQFAVPPTWTTYTIDAVTPYAVFGDGAGAFEPGFLPLAVQTGLGSADPATKRFDARFVPTHDSDVAFAARSSVVGACESSTAVVQNPHTFLWFPNAVLEAGARGMTGLSECCTTLGCPLPMPSSTLAFTAPAAGANLALASIGAAGYPADRYVYFVPASAGAADTVPVPPLPAAYARPEPSGQRIDWTLETTQGADWSTFRYARFKGRQTTGVSTVVRQ